MSRVSDEVIARYGRAELLAELSEMFSMSPIADNEITADMLAEATGLSRVRCAERLNAQVAAGKLSVRDARSENGRRVRAYRKVESME